MAAALSQVTQNYDWTLKRADNDLRNAITTPQPQTPSPASPSHQDIKPVDSSGAFPWDVRLCFSICEREGHLLKFTGKSPSIETRDRLRGTPRASWAFPPHFTQLDSICILPSKGCSVAFRRESMQSFHLRLTHDFNGLSEEAPCFVCCPLL